MSLKSRISSPLEAGTSILDAHHLPPSLSPALEYAARRLARKGVHITLLVIRRDYQIPAAAPTNPDTNELDSTLLDSVPNPQQAATPTATGPFRSGFASALRHLVRTGTHPVLHSLDRTTASDLQRSQTVSPTFSRSSSESTSTTPRWPLSPNSPLPMTPATPATTIPSSTASSTTTTSTASHCSLTSTPFPIRLIHAHPLTLRQDRLYRQTTTKTHYRFLTHLPPAVPPSTYALPPELLARSAAQRELLFHAPGLTLLSLDHLYTFKAALSSYSRSNAPFCLEDAVDELRRYVLANGRRKLPRTRLVHTYKGLLAFSEAALRDVGTMYGRAYGGGEEDCGIEGDGLSACPVGAEVLSRRDEPEVVPEEPELEIVLEVEDEPEPGREEVQVATPKSSPALKGPALKLQTNFDTIPGRRKAEVVEVVDEKQWEFGIPVLIEEAEEWEDGNVEKGEEDGDLTARPTGSGTREGGLAFWNNVSIDQILHDRERERDSQHLGPTTPHGYDDISPITRGEWGFAMGQIREVGRQVPVTTF